MCMDVMQPGNHAVLFPVLHSSDVNRKCWYVTTKGMHAVGQAEVVILLQCLPDEKTIPKDIFTHFVQLYQEALSGKNTTDSSTRKHTRKLVHLQCGPLLGEIAAH